VALKEVKIKQMISKRQYNDVINEVEIMKKIQHPNIIELYDSFIDVQFDVSTLKRKNKDYQSEILSSHDSYTEENNHKKVGGKSLYIAMEYAELGDMQALIN
jgi:serine/threonine protein kinase